jgi:hypothetical protein
MSWLYTIFIVGAMFSNSSNDLRVETIPANDQVSRPTAGQQDETERIDKTYPLSANGRVSVSNVNGSVTVIPTDRNEVRLVAIKTADTKEHLADVNIKIDARDDSFSVETDYGDDRGRNGDSDRPWKNNDKTTVDYELTVPRGAILNEIETVNGSVSVADFTNFVKISAVNGTVKAGNLRGTADLSTVNGEVIADFERLAPGSKISLDTVNGRVNLTIPSDTSAVLKAESLNGAITNDFGLPNRRGKYVGNSLHGRLGTGDSNIKLESVNGPLTVKRRNDGKALSPATNLLPAKGADDDDDGDVDVDVDMSKADLAKMNREIDRNVRDAQRKAAQDAQRELNKLKTDLPKIKTETLENINKSIDSNDLEKAIQDGVNAQTQAWSAMRDAGFFMGVPRIETKANSIVVKGTPKVIIDAKGCAVRVRGWDNAAVKYSITQMRGGPMSAAPVVTENHSDTAVNITVADQPGLPAFDGSEQVHIEVFVPKRSNLKIISDGEIRLEGVSGELEITGGGESIDVRDSSGKMNLLNARGRVRVIGFDGEMTAQTGDGDVYLEGNFAKLTGRGGSGEFVLTLPPNANADVSSNSAVEADGFTLNERGKDSWRLGSGGALYSFNLEDGKVTVRNSSTLNLKAQ